MRSCGAVWCKDGVPQWAIEDREVERISLPLRSPHPACHIDLQFKCQVDQEQLMANNGHDFNIYKDGSKIEGKVNAALSVWRGAAETKTLKLALPSDCTVYQKELLTIYKF
ncbi:unnamed protein product [Euphydryas editha]|uniref:Uncharacterized protein n=1 Tax=Euphydryas editha TaxID=104508 RepID=A0AAU9V8G7_EUPED|nr:unnamed protein product [Euphydryas editha]